MSKNSKTAITKICLDNIGKNFTPAYEALCSHFTYKEAAKLPKSEFYKFLDDQFNELSSADKRNIMCGLFKPECMNAKSILGIVKKEEVVEEEADDEEQEESETDEDETEEQYNLKKYSRKISGKITFGRLRNAKSLNQAFLLMQTCIYLLDKYTEEDLKELDLNDIQAIVYILRTTYSCMLGAARKHFPVREFRDLSK